MISNTEAREEKWGEGMERKGYAIVKKRQYRGKLNEN
jgi:hypothetical protein